MLLVLLRRGVLLVLRRRLRLLLRLWRCRLRLLMRMHGWLPDGGLQRCGRGLGLGDMVRRRQSRPRREAWRRLGVHDIGWRWVRWLGGRSSCSGVEGVAEARVTVGAVQRYGWRWAQAERRRAGIGDAGRCAYDGPMARAVLH